MPMNDPNGVMFPHLEAITPQLKDIFDRAFVSVTAVTQKVQPDYMAWLAADDFFQAVYHENDVPVGDDFMALYANAAVSCHPDQVLHLCFIDRVAFALQTNHQQAFVSDIQAVQPENTPLIFQRSVRAWDTHPQNYRKMEQIVTEVGELLFKRTLDFGWCHLAIQAGELLSILPHIKNRDLSMIAEFTLVLKDKVQMKDVDWLSWEDPFIYTRDPQQMKAEREQSLAETHKRLAYAIPMLNLLAETNKSSLP